MRKLTKTLIVGTAILLAQIVIQGQTTTGSLAGTVTDPGNAVIAGASVTVTNVTTGAERTGITNSSGAFDFQTLLPGSYTVAVEASGFKKAIVRDVIVSVASTAQLNIPLEIGLANETVTVTTNQEVINSTSPTLTNVINTRQVVDLPLGGRKPVELAALQAGIAVVGTDTRGASVGGLRQTAVNLTQDGINAMDNFVKTSSFFAITTPSLNSTQEFSITTGTVGSDAGRGAAQVNLVTKGGTNEFHGGAFLQLINESYNANTFFNNFNGTVKPVLRQHFYEDLALFAQDQWRLKPNFTLNYGARWDYMGVPTATNGLAIQPIYSDLYGISGFGNLFKPTAPHGSHVKVDVATPATVNAQLEPGNINETVVVASGAEVLQTETATVGTTINGRQILETPIQSRDALDLVTTLPGTTTTGVVRTSSINGLPKSALTIQIDGVDMTECSGLFWLG